MDSNAKEIIGPQENPAVQDTAEVHRMRCEGCRGLEHWILPHVEKSNVEQHIVLSRPR